MSFSQAELDALRTAYASGVTEVRYDGKTTRYDDGAALLKRIQVVENSISRSVAGKKAPVAGYATFRRD